MKSIILTGCLMLAVFFGASAQGIRFENKLSWQEIKNKAQQENKFIFVDFHATWCAPCKLMDAEVFTVKEVGDAYNNRFISVKVQTDKTAKDNSEVKEWYADAAKLSAENHVTVLPTQLFFTPEGKLIYRRGGSTDVRGVIQLAEKAINSEKENLPLIEKYQKGEVKLEDYPGVAEKAKQMGNDELSDKISLKYIHEYMNKLSDEDLLSKANYSFLFQHSGLLEVTDKIFRLSHDQPKLVSEKTGDSWGTRLAEWTLAKEINKWLWKDGAPIYKKPNWKVLSIKIEKAYGSMYVTKTLALLKIGYYEALKQWSPYADAVEQYYLKYNPTRIGNSGDNLTLNNRAWFGIFLNTDEPKLLLRATKWADVAIARLGKDNPESETIYDTKANLLYKAGKKNEAIAEEQALIDMIVKRTGKEASKSAKGFKETLEKMEKGLPTWEE